MPKLRDLCKHLRSKAAGPFWVTIDLFFSDHENFEVCKLSKSLSSEVIGSLYGTNPVLVKRFYVSSLDVIKISYPRPSPQGGITERDMHCGQQYVRLLDLEII